jgi:hypothetical protein
MFTEPSHAGANMAKRRELCAAYANIPISRLVLVAVATLSPRCAFAEQKTVIVGVTPTCPYGLSACWAGAYGALSSLDGVKSVSSTPDAYNCTAAVELDGDLLSRLRRWGEQFKSATGDAYKYRGVEVSLVGTVVRRDNRWLLKPTDVEEPLLLARLNHKVQWNFRKGKARQAEPDERRAFRDLTARVEENSSPRVVEVVGPLRFRGEEVVLEVREFYWVESEMP